MRRPPGQDGDRHRDAEIGGAEPARGWLVHRALQMARPGLAVRLGAGGMTVRCRSAPRVVIAAVVSVGRNGSPASAGGTMPRCAGAIGVIPGGGGGGEETGRLVGPSIRLGAGSARPGSVDDGGLAMAAGAIGAGATGGGVTGAGATGGGPSGRGDASGALPGIGSGRLRRPTAVRGRRPGWAGATAARRRCRPARSAHRLARHGGRRCRPSRPARRPTRHGGRRHGGRVPGQGAVTREPSALTRASQPASQARTEATAWRTSRPPRR
ncbi:hypothetical protein GA0070619_0010 [Micromonospora zamorensis]|nr:hypothetical protein GA0070619_0010 [Micromonospora zamorensis]